MAARVELLMSVMALALDTQQHNGQTVDAAVECLR